MFSGRLSPSLCQRHPETTFVFGDNLLGFGKGGQAIIRSEPNAFGIPTKRKPSMAPGSFFEEGSDSDLDAVLAALNVLWTRLENDLIVVIPVNAEGEVSLGLERAELRERAPSIYNTIANHVREMQMAHGWEARHGL
jgi:hypothetical protein